MLLDEQARSSARGIITAVVRQLPTAVIALDADFVVLATSPRAAQMLGRAREEAGFSLRYAVPLEEGRWPEIRGEAFAGGTARVATPAGTFRVEAWGPSAAKPEGLLVHVEPPEVDRALEARLAERERFIRDLFERSPIGLNLCRMDGLWLESNQAFLDILGYSREEADGGLTYWQLTPRKYDEDEARQLESLAKNGRFGPYEKEFIRKDGTTVPVRLNGFLLERDGERYIWSLIEDIRERRALEERLEHERMHAIHSAKLATLGQMAASIAHEINNPLAVIAAAAYVIAEHTQGEEALVTEAVADARAAVARTATIVHGLRRFARFDSEEPPEPVAVASILENAVALCRPRVVTHGVSLVSTNESSASVLCAPIEVEHVLVNLLNNAIDAVSSGAKGSRREVRISACDAGDLVEIRVADSGPGVSPELADRIFEPFFTTKPAGEGTGIGLSIARRVVTRFGGSLELEQGAPGGATFVVRLPRIAPG